jgi:hypothetical protein
MWIMDGKSEREFCSGKKFIKMEFLDSFGVIGG